MLEKMKGKRTQTYIYEKTIPNFSLRPIFVLITSRDINQVDYQFIQRYPILQPCFDNTLLKFQAFLSHYQRAILGIHFLFVYGACQTQTRDYK